MDFLKKENLIKPTYIRYLKTRFHKEYFRFAYCN